MYVKDLVNETLKDIIFNGKTVPVSKNKYTGDSKTYIYYYVLTQELSHADDIISNSIVHFTADIYTDNVNYDTLIDEVIDRLQNSGFAISGINSEMYETDTKLYHIPVDFCIERYEIL